MMFCNSLHFLGFLAFLLVGIWTIQISDAAARYESHGYTGRSLLQTQKSCPVDFQSQNYSIITSQCKGPSYPVKPCCRAFKEFACNFTEAINDVSTDCVNTMFSYISINGNYPPGLFANECKEGKEGLDCSTITPGEGALSNTTASPMNSGVGFLCCAVSSTLALVLGVAVALLL